MKLPAFVFYSVFSYFLFSFAAFGQSSEQVLAVANGQKFTVQDLPPKVRESYLTLPKTIADARQTLLSQQIIETMLQLEAAARKIPVETLIEKEVTSKVPNPTEREITAVYNANDFGNRTLAEVRQQIISFLRREPEQKYFQNLITRLRNKFKAGVVKNVNAPDLKPTDILAVVGLKKITVRDFEAKNKVALYETKATVLDEVKAALKEIIYFALVTAEAKALGISSSDLISREITQKIREYSETESEELEDNFRRRLFNRYQAQILLKEPPPLVLPVATDGNPSIGPENAPVTVVMFSDFQCSACAAYYPVLKKVIAKYGEKVRLVVRYFPLTSIHQNALLAAKAAAAAHAQGNFFEYTEILYRNQNALDSDSLKKYAVDLGLNLAQFESDMQSAKTAAKISRDIADGKSYGITGTPAIYVNGVKLRVLSASGLREAIDKVIQ
jgi:protein-disulfide isomerase